MKSQKKVLLFILDGFGFSVEKNGNAVALAKKPFLEKLWKENSTVLVETSGNAVGLPNGEVGTSEAGHVTIGSGRIVWQPLEEIGQEIKNGKFFEKKELLKIFEKKGKLHLFGILSDGGVHGHEEHLYALLKLAKKMGKQAQLHLVADGRDVGTKSLKTHLKRLEEKISEIGVGKICSVVGRFYAMDRDKNLDRTKKFFDLVSEGKGEVVSGAKDLLKKCYEKAENDYYLEPYIFPDFEKIKKQDSVICWNFRSDRSRQITKMFEENGFENFLAFGPYTSHYPVLYPAKKLKNNLQETLAKNKKTQLRAAETEKFAHVTFFFNSQNHEKVKGEERLLVDSPKCASYAEKPEMSAYKLTEKLEKKLKENFDFVAVNFANTDLVGHSGNLETAKKSVEVVDECLSRLVPLARQEGYEVLIGADHGNCEKMLSENGEVNASHTSNSVRFTLVSEKKLRDLGGLKDVAPTVLELLGIEKPEEMSGESLVKL